MLVTPGTIRFTCDPVKNPSAFSKGVNYHWGEFSVGKETCVITSEGKTLIGKMNPETDREFMIFSTNVKPIPNDKQIIGITWDNKQIKLYFNGEPLHTEVISDYLP